MKPLSSNPVVGANQAFLSIKLYKNQDEGATSTKTFYKELIKTTLVQEGYSNFTVKVVSLKRLVAYVNFVRAEVNNQYFMSN